MDAELSIQFNGLLKKLALTFGEGMDLTSILFLVGINEVQVQKESFSKKEKMDLIHVAICCLLEPYGYYKFLGNDKDNWPHYELLKKLPNIGSKQQEQLLYQAVIDYFKENNL